MDIKDFLGILRKRWWVAAVVVLACAVASALVMFLLVKPTYEANAKVIVEQPSRVVILTQRSATLPPNLSIETHVKLLQGLEVAEEAVKILYSRTGVSEGAKLEAEGDRWLEKDASRYRNRVHVLQEQDTGILTIHVEGQAADECAQVANAFKDAFIKVSGEFAKKTTNEAREVIEEQLQTATKQLEDAEKALFVFQDEHGVVNLDEEFTAINNQIIDYELMAKQDNLKSDELMQQISGIERQYMDVNTSADTKDSFISVDWFRRFQAELTDLETQKANLLRTLTPEHPQILEIENKGKILERELEQKTEKLITKNAFDIGLYVEDANELAHLKTEHQIYLNRFQVINNVVDQLKAKLNEYPALTYQYGRLERTKSIAEKVFFVLKEKEQQALIDEVQNKLNVTSLEDARPADNPFKPDRWKNIGLSAILGLLLGVFFIFLLEEFEESIKTGDQVSQYLNLPVLGTIPYSTETINKLITDIPLKSPLAEAYRRLSFFTQLFCLDPPVKTLLITSSKSDEGKSTTLANLAISMAQEGAKVLVIDTDLRRPMLHRMFGVDNSLGLSSILSGELEAELAVSDMAANGRLPKEELIEVLVDRLIQPLDIKGLSIMPSGPLPANSVELLRSERMLTFLEIIGRKADIVLFDSPPAIHVIDAVVLAQILDGVLLVINSGRIKRLEAINVKQMIESTKTPIIGVALNNIEQSSPDYYYYYYYGGYGYGSQQRRKRVKLRR